MKPAASRSGFATLTALFMIGLVGTFLLTLSSMFVQTSRRTALSINESQLRQLLIAGEASARAQLVNRQSKNGDVDLPRSLIGSGASLSIQWNAVAADDARGKIQASVANLLLDEELHYRLDQGKWVLVSADLGRPHRAEQPARASTASTRPRVKPAPRAPATSPGPR